MPLLEPRVDSYTSIETWLYSTVFDSNVTYMILTSFIWHWILFYISKYTLQRYSQNFLMNKPAQQAYWCAVVVSGIHAGVTGVGVLPFIFDKWSTTDFIISQSTHVDFYDLYASGYFFYDLSLMVFMALTSDHPGFKDPFFWSHHIFGIAIFPFLVAQPTAWMSSMFLVQELTGPFANGRALIAYHGYRHTPLYTMNGIVMVLLFTLVRIFLPVMVWYRLYTEWASFEAFVPYTLLLMATTGAVLSMFLNTTWYYLMVKGLIKMLRGEKFKPKDE
eukprot:m.16617 g.16617  ORF g.16617 m.16617 type:complete len:275 (-) comp10591_c0_seq2:65-889(-)